MRWWLALASLPLVVLAADGAAHEKVEEPSPEVPHRLTAPPLAKALPLPLEQDLLTLAEPTLDGHLGVKQGGATQVLTVDVELQRQLTELLRTYQTPYAAVVALEPATGRVLAMAEHSEDRPELRGLCTKAVYPAASLFKIVTAAALLEEGLAPSTTECVHGGYRRLTASLLESSPADTRCLTMSEAMGQSANVVFARLTARYLDAGNLARAARAFRFNTPLRFAIPTEVSLAAFPRDTYDLALTGAGFGDVFLSPVHGAALAAVVANHGVWRTPVLFEKDVVSAPGEPVVSPQIASQLADMLQLTVTAGTARRIFHERGNSLPDAVGKTGSLADQRPFRDYTWFIGYAPKDSPRIAVAAVIVNDPHWRIRATWLGREAMRLFLTRRSKPIASAVLASADTAGSALDAGVGATPDAPSPPR